MVHETTKRDPERIYLEPWPYSPEGRLWCEDAVWPLDGDGPGGVEYVRADLHATEISRLSRELEEARERERALWALATIANRVRWGQASMDDLSAAVDRLYESGAAHPSDRSESDGEPRTYRLVRFADVLELDDRQFEVVIDGLPDVLRAARAARTTLRAAAEAWGLPDPCPDASACLPHIDWIDDGERAIRLHIDTTTGGSDGER